MPAIDSILRWIVITLALTLAITGSLVAADVGAQGAEVTRGEGCGYGAELLLHVTTPSGNNLVVCQGNSGDEGMPIHVNPTDPKDCTSFDEVTTNSTIIRRHNGGQTVVCRFNPSGQ